MSDGPYQRVECDEPGCSWENEGPTALMLGKKHATAHGHDVFWLQETTGWFSGGGASD